jgi:DNA primase
MARVKAAWPITSYLVYFEPGLKLEGRGEWRACLCPWHDDHNPSLRINIVSNTWRCFACGAFGDVVNWHARKLGVDQHAAARDLARYQVKVGM